MKDLEKLLKLPLLKNRFDLQLFTDDGGDDNNDSGNEPDNDPNNPSEGDDPDDKTKKYSDEDVDKLISKKFAEWEKKRQKEEAKIKEAEKLKNMTAQEKKDLEFKQLQKKIANYEKQATLSEMSKVARSILADEEISVNDELLTNLVSEDADTTKANVENFAKIFKAAVQKEVAAKLHHEPPKKGSKSKMTKEDILKVENTAERQKLIKENMDLFK